MSITTKFIFTSTDVRRVERLLEQLPVNAFPWREALEEKLMRADVVEPHDAPSDLVTMNSKVKFRVNRSDEFVLTLVYPKDMDNSESKISIFAPVGSALLGLRVGGEVEWPNPEGKLLNIEILDILYQPEKEGEYHR
jgi:regulator of nucleoside diphosphate kinase